MDTLASRLGKQISQVVTELNAAEPAPHQRPVEAADPYLALDELMVVVESLCPRWPEKEASRLTVGYLL